LKFEGVFFAKVKFDDEKDSCRLWWIVIWGVESGVYGFFNEKRCRCSIFPAK
jgi:hypothetical protein